MTVERARVVAIGCSIVLLVLTGFQALGSQANFVLPALSLMFCLASLGTLLGRVKEGYGYSVAAGLFGIVGPGAALVAGRPPNGVGFQLAVLVAAAVLLVSGLLLRRAGDPSPPSPGA